MWWWGREVTAAEEFAAVVFVGGKTVKGCCLDKMSEVSLNWKKKVESLRGRM